MRTLLESKGYFLADVHYTVHEKERTADIQYDIAIDPPYRINGISVKGDSTSLLNAIRSTMSKTMLSPGDQYDVAKMKQERERIDSALKEKGYFYFSPDFILFQADSTAGNRTVDLSLEVKKDIPVEAPRVYTIGSVYIYSGYSLDRDSVAIRAGDTAIVDDAAASTSTKSSTLPSSCVRFFFRRGAV